MWYEFTAPTDGIATADTFGSDYDTLLSVYTGACDALTSVPDGCNDDAPNTAQSQVTFAAAGGTTYVFMTTAYKGDGGHLVFDLSFQPNTTATPTPSVTGVPTGPTTTPTPTGTVAATPSKTATATPTGTVPVSCVGDCNADGTVAIDEIVLLIDIALEAQPPSACAAGHRETVTVADLVEAVNHALEGCSGG